jgi:hypothetical protein
MEQRDAAGRVEGTDKYTMKWRAHVYRMENNRLPNQRYGRDDGEEETLGDLKEDDRTSCDTRNRT